MKVFQIVLGLALVTTLTACNKVVDEAKDLSNGAVSVVNETAQTVGQTGETMMDEAKEMGEQALDGMAEGKEVMDEMIEKGGDVMEDALEAGEDVMEKTGKLMDKAEETVTALAATYTAYENEAGAGKKHVLFFHADWCGTCVKWEGKVNEYLQSLPKNALILKVDYDNNAELAAQYGVTKQSSAVFINQDGSVAKIEADPSMESVSAFFE